MVLRLDPRLPLVWRSPVSLQFGVDRPAVRLDDVSEAEERMLAALSTGVTRDGLAVVAASAGADEASVARLLGAVGPALLARRPRAEPHRVVVSGSGAAAERIADALVGSGVAVLHEVDVDRVGARPDLAVIVDDFVLPPQAHAYWLRRDIRHLPVVFGDAVVRIGPLVEPGTGPCLYCVERARVDADPARPAIASQLWGRRSPLHGAAVDAEAAAIVARTVAARFDGGPSRTVSAASIALDPRTGVTTTERWQPHPECGCRVPRGTATADAQPPASAPSPTTTAAAATAPA